VSGGSPHLGQRLPLVVGLQGGPRGVGVGGRRGSPPWLADVGAGAEEVVVDACAVRWLSGVIEVRGSCQVRGFVVGYKLGEEMLRGTKGRVYRGKK
jgi:hypothetical protein